MATVKEVHGVTVSIEPPPNQKLTEEYLAHLKEAVNSSLNPVTHLGIDPGKANGICGYDDRYYLMFMLVISSDDIVMFLHQFEHIKKCIIEGYRVFPNKVRDHIYSDLETPRVIGRVEYWAETKKVDLIKQPSHIKPTGYKWIGQKPLAKSNKKNHAMDAHVHFTYWAVTSGHIKLEDLLKK